MKKTTTLKFIFFLILLYLLVFQNLIQKYIKPFQFFDELLAIYSLVAIVVNLFNRKGSRLEKEYRLLFFIFFIIIITGLFSNLVHEYQPISIALSDLLIFSKFYLIVIFSSLYFNSDFIKENNKKINKHLNYITIVLFLFTIANYLFVLYPYESRYGILSNTLFYSHPTYLAAISIFLIALRVIVSKKLFSLGNMINILILLSTLRSKAIGGAVITIIIAYMISRRKKKISFSKLGVVGIIIFIFGYNQFSYYFFTDDFARSALLNTSFKIAKEYFPFGTGFGTFASYYSAVSYSPVYRLYGINNVWGLSSAHPMYVSDVFWPMVLGQFGYIGLILYASCLFVLFKKIQNDFDEDNLYLYAGKLICFIYLIISSMAETAFSGPISVALALIIGIKCIKHKENEKI